MGALLAFGAIDLLALDVVVGPRVLDEAPPAADEPAPAPVVAAVVPAPPPRVEPPKPPAPPREAPPLSADDLRPVIVHFATDRATVDDAAARALDRLAARLAEDPRGSVEIVGHADRRGTERHNEDLSMRRMEGVRDYLAAHGVAVARLHGRAAGAREPAVSGAGPAALAADRRAEIRRKP
jgi:outer membrane protein OmpA-like peptidoglycan-associated protein